MYHSTFLHGDPSTRKPGLSAIRCICCGRIRTLASLTARARSRPFRATWTHAECGLGRPRGRERKRKVLAQRSLRPSDWTALTGWCRHRPARAWSKRMSVCALVFGLFALHRRRPQRSSGWCRRNSSSGWRRARFTAHLAKVYNIHFECRKATLIGNLSLTVPHFWQGHDLAVLFR
jgi:hypothetical protein